MSRKARKQALPHVTAADVAKHLAEAATHVEAIRQAVDQVFEDTMPLLKAVNRGAAGQDAVRTLIVQEIGQLRTDLAGKLSAHVLQCCCRELAPVMNAVQRMRDADLTDAALTRSHIESLALTLESAFERMGIHRVAPVPGRDVFDSRVHECVAVCTPADSTYPDAPTGTIVGVEAPGYLVDGHVSLAAKVVVQKLETQDAQPQTEPEEERQS